MGYTRQSETELQGGQPAVVAPFNAEFNAIETAFNGVGGHQHTGGVGDGARIDFQDINNRPTVPGLSDSDPQPLGSAAEGTSTDASRADHVHALPSAADIGAAATSHSHSNASTSVAGYMSASDKSKLDGYPASTSSLGTVRSVSGTDGVSGTVTTTGSLSVDSTVARRNATNDFANSQMQNMIILGEGYPVIAKGTVSGSVTCDLSTGSFFTMTVGASTTQVTFSNAKSGRAHIAYLAVTFTSSPTFSVTGDLTKGSPAPFVYSSTSANSQSWSTSGTDILQCITFNGGSTWYIIRLVASPT